MLTLYHEFTANKLMDKIVKSNSWIHTLQDAMEQAVKIDQEIRQTEVFRTRRNASITTIDTTANASVNEIEEFNVNYMAAKQGDTRFNSTHEAWSPQGKQRVLPPEQI